MTTSVEKSVTVDAPVSVVYNTWTQFEDFPLFMGGVQEVRQLGDNRLHWVAEIAGVKREWDATILEQVRDEKIAWAATEGATNAGTVRFAASGPDRTMVTLTLEYEPEGLVEKAGDFLNIVERRAEADMENFRKLIADGPREPGGWRGEINPGAGVQPGVESATSSGDSGKSGVSGKAVAAGVVAGAAAVAAGVAASKSGDDSEELPPVQTDDFRTETDVVVTETVTPVEVDVVPTPVEDHAVHTSVEDDAMLADGTETYPMADDPAPFNDATGDDHPDGSNRTV
jgi:uncharacterized protein YndB with AHSA1/START domain